MTQNQIAYQANLIRQQEADTNKLKLEEEQRANMAKEKLQTVDLGIKGFSAASKAYNDSVSNKASVLGSILKLGIL